MATYRCWSARCWATRNLAFEASTATNGAVMLYELCRLGGVVSHFTMRHCLSFDLAYDITPARFAAVPQSAVAALANLTSGSSSVACSLPSSRVYARTGMGHPATPRCDGLVKRARCADAHRLVGRRGTGTTPSSGVGLPRDDGAGCGLYSSSRSSQHYLRRVGGEPLQLSFCATPYTAVHAILEVEV
ncbi:hypothetical protein HYPSUDRAFT_467839 [Hypholoma sublateritium FD-334 SS-4]|uniref:Uncharacterized protein n=1 Tax=Hypholoma sublateritium (strain FD-334 SS-4) TaxID=945553 RepID=A0A0D2NZY0_HYPSF|nr:hypothetical protein HYPSUDRAFT_467839 [Hypholoma sublateritium FD-334 SS-4]